MLTVSMSMGFSIICQHSASGGCSLSIVARLIKKNTSYNSLFLVCLFVCLFKFRFNLSWECLLHFEASFFVYCSSFATVLFIVKSDELSSLAPSALASQVCTRQSKPKISPWAAHILEKLISCVTRFSRRHGKM